MSQPAPREAAAAPPAAPVPRRRNPWWIPPFLGRVPAADPRSFQVLGVVTLGMFFESYDLSLLSAALKHIAADIGMQEQQLGGYLSAIRLGGLVAFGLLPMADRIGRRRVFLASLAGMSLGTLATALAATPEQFVAFQIFTRAFLATGAAVGVVMLTEEFPAEHRGWAIGILGALSALGHGLGALLFAAVDALPFGWRALYAVGAFPLLLLPFFRSALDETTRFREHQARGVDGHLLQSLGALARQHPRRAACVGAAGMLFALGGISVFQFASYFVQTEHAWEPWQYSLMMIASGGIGIAGNVVAGRLGDVWGRRRVGFAAFSVFPLAAMAFYLGPGWALPLCFVLIVFTSSAGDVILRAVSTELFPTSQRAASAAWLTLLQTFGWIGGLWLVGGGTQRGEALTGMIAILSAGVGVAGLLVLLLPETSGRELEALSSD